MNKFRWQQIIKVVEQIYSVLPGWLLSSMIIANFIYDIIKWTGTKLITKLCSPHWWTCEKMCMQWPELQAMEQMHNDQWNRGQEENEETNNKQKPLSTNGCLHMNIIITTANIQGLCILLIAKICHKEYHGTNTDITICHPSKVSFNSMQECVQDYVSECSGVG